mmetsp:Transcript_28328/g.47892  ORF Transcript_28328/g.47892 Transcript_28328/m.47892 type:complete len:227 (-) Transcript_28328:861-1541(-)
MLDNVVSHVQLFSQDANARHQCCWRSNCRPRARVATNDPFTARFRIWRHLNQWFSFKLLLHNRKPIVLGCTDTTLYRRVDFLVYVVQRALHCRVRGHIVGQTSTNTTCGHLHFIMILSKQVAKCAIFSEIRLALVLQYASEIAFQSPRQILQHRFGLRILSMSNLELSVPKHSVSKDSQHIHALAQVHQTPVVRLSSTYSFKHALNSVNYVNRRTALTQVERWVLK